MLAAQAAAGGARWLVTEDGPFRRACGPALRRIADLDVVSVAELLRTLDRSVRGETYRPAELMGTDVVVRPVHAEELDRLARTFVNHRAGERLGEWRARLSAYAADLNRTEMYVFASEQELLALIVLRDLAVIEVPVCRVRRGQAEPTLARQTLGWLRSRAVDQQSLAVQITDPAPGQWIERACVDEGFLPEPQPIAVPARGSGTFQDLADHLNGPELQDRLMPSHAAELRALAPTPEAALSVEAVFHPFIVLGAGLRTYRVPIKPHYAADLFDHSLSAGQLFTRDRSVALRREHVYFRSPTGGGLAAPARILWYVSGSPAHGGRTIRGMSLLNDVVVGDVDQLISRFSHLGVLDRGEILSQARGGSVMALRFSHTTVMSRPVSLDDYRGMVNELDHEHGLTLVGPQRVSEQVFAAVVTMGA